jgi:hypothetical protein
VAEGVGEPAAESRRPSSGPHDPPERLAVHAPTAAVHEEDTGIGTPHELRTRSLQVLGYRPSRGVSDRDQPLPVTLATADEDLGLEIHVRRPEPDELGGA